MTLGTLITFGATLLAAPRSAEAQPAPAAPDAKVEIRLALSEAAARTLFEPRMRRLVQIETESFATLAPSAVGPFQDRVADVWVAQPTLAKVVVEVRVTGGAVEHREIAVRGLAGDVAARLVALAVADLVRAAAMPRPPELTSPLPKVERTAEEAERLLRAAPALLVGGAVDVAGLPGSNGVMAGPSLAFGFRRFGLSESLFGSWREGPAYGTTARWLEVGVGVDYRFWLGRSFRLALGAEGALASVHLADATSLQGAAGEHDTWSARAGGKVALELRVARPLWLTLNLTPGAVLRTVRFTEGASTPAGTVGGVWLGASLGVLFEYLGD